MQLPQSFIESLRGVTGFNQDAFEKVHLAEEQITSVRINPAKKGFEPKHFENAARVPWTNQGYYLAQRPSFTFDPLFHAGCYYVQEASSMFLEQALSQTVDLSKPLAILDLSAAPGGKTTHIQSLISSDSLLVSNEVIKARAAILKQNITKWGSANVIVTNNDPQHFQKLEGFFDAIVVDAPCSGSGLFRKDEKAISEWSLDHVQLCSGRQQRILADVLPALKEDGVLIYSTCSYSPDENEVIMDWLVNEQQLQNIPLAINSEWGIVKTQSNGGAEGYRFYPDKVKGEGFFIACFKKLSGSEKSYKATKPSFLSAKEKEFVTPWLQSDTKLQLLKHGDSVLALPAALVEKFSIVQAALYLQYAGVTVGTLMRNKLVPDHALAMSNLLSASIEVFDVDYETAIKYLQRQDINRETKAKGWQLISYKNHPLGWVNALPNRINNYYPKELRILKQHND